MVQAGPRPAQAREAEDFVIAESLQLRNLHVYLNARDLGGLGADARQAAGQAHRDGGPVIEAVAELEPEGRRRRAAAVAAGRPRPGCSGTTTRCPT